ncbi:MAG: hypothetical protein ACFFD4_29695 [Candidatus Odinarchaeota archaeon]
MRKVVKIIFIAGIVTLLVIPVRGGNDDNLSETFSNNYRKQEMNNNL